MPADFTSTDFDSADFDRADEVVRRFHERGGQPAISYGVVANGTLVHAAGFGSRWLDGPVVGKTPDERTVFRIASMSKSFTASAVLLLRDSGALALDDPAARYVPELAGWGDGTRDAGPVTVRQLLTMTAGFPTDDPWGDRQQGLPAAAFRGLLAGGVGFNWAPGSRFEYSNLGYAVLGLVIAAASGMPYDEFVRTRLLEPLGMSGTGFAAEEFPEGDLAHGYRRGAGGWEEVPFAPYGAFAPMGGVFSTVADLAGWAAGFAAAFPGGGPSPARHPLSAASRRQMQLPQAVISQRAAGRIPGGPPVGPAFYGFGLFVDEDPALGRIVSHSGGDPGYGSNMRWHLASGTGVIALANGTYAGMWSMADTVLRTLLAAGGHRRTPRPALGPAGAGLAAGPWPETLAAADKVHALLLDWDDTAADAVFSENVALDRPYAERRADLALLRSRIGAFTVDETRSADSETPAHRRWWVAGERGSAAVTIQLNPELPPRVQSLALAVPPAPGSALGLALDSVVDWLNAPAPAGPAKLPEDLQVAPGADAALIARRLRMAGVWAGRVVTGGCYAGDGFASVTVDLIGEHSAVALSLLVNPATGELRQADVVL